MTSGHPTSFIDWVSSPSSGAQVDFRGSIGGDQAYTAQIRFRENISDPPVSDVVVALMTDGWGQMGCDLGFGRIPTQELRPGSFTVAPANVSAEGWGTGEVEVVLLGLPWARYRPLLETVTRKEVKDFGVLHSRVHRDERVQHLLQNLWTESESRQGGTLYEDGLILALCGRFLALASVDVDRISEGMTAKVAARAQDFILSQLHRDLSLAEIATVVGYSPAHLSRMFRITFGESPYAFVLRMRLQKAIELLRGTDVTAAEIAKACGFYDQAHMNRHLRRRYGITPTDLRN